MDKQQSAGEQPLAALRRRLGAQPWSGDPGAERANVGEDQDESDLIPSWVPDGRTSRGQAWLTAIRADPGRAGAFALAAIAALAVLITVFTVIRSRPAHVVSANLPSVDLASSAVPHPTSGSPGPLPSEAATAVVVSVVGLVNQPGLVTLAPEARIADAVEAAGGTVKGADTLGLNLARHVADGEQIVVGIAAPAGHKPVFGSSAGPATAGPAPASSTAKPSGPLDLNTASIEQLDALPGVGPVTAAAIIAWRNANGRFASVDQLGEVDGIGPGRLDKLRPLVRV